MRAMHLGLKSMQENSWSVAYSTDLKLGQQEVYNLPYMKIKVTNPV